MDYDKIFNTTEQLTIINVLQDCKGMKVISKEHPGKAISFMNVLQHQ